MRCPLCGTAAKDGSAECASCGVVFAKLRKKLEREKIRAAAALEASAPPPARDPWRTRLAALAVVAAWMIGLALYYAACAPRARPGRSRATTDLRGVEVHRSAISPRPEPRAPDVEGPPPPGAPAPDADFDD
jgi:hypothetical protein